jgi:hypothetical protein
MPLPKRTLFALALACLSCSNNPGNGALLGNGTFTVPSCVVVGKAFSASFAPDNPGAYADVKVLPVSTDFFTGSGSSLVPLHVGDTAALYAFANGEVLDFVSVNVRETCP